jgi:hypothetical protein
MTRCGLDDGYRGMGAYAAAKLPDMHGSDGG